ncbi:[protein-PII] uridylyltransferase [Thioalkalivibrio sp. XN8]|uniref:[protein-PII] uridylyltransferase n=1 Tax=Thioalkalivibrio sp. XN8 TaxID=2712863 RepID=UPI0013EC1860|nr:[protein-PII] uridylyltransferase [Thioalkalivibrio sp. XN8]NGP53629.1 [protein-PII] uridylyltransferase [Thioalkalivibrio sp. XN8]
MDTATRPAAAQDPQLPEVDAAPGPAAVRQFRQVLEAGDRQLRARFEAEEPVEALVRDRARLIDIALVRAWRMHLGDAHGELALVAVGGYGRGELHPCSDIDIMVVVPAGDDSAWRERVSGFLTFLWDIGMEVGHSVRTLADCEREAAADVTVVTTLMESRLLDGAPGLFEAMQAATAPERVWPAAEFFTAKRDEQTARHHRYHDTAHNLEPNIKGTPGGLRDIQVVCWIAKRQFGVGSLHQLAQQGFLTDYEYRRLLAGQNFLWKIRWALHTVTGRREDRLLFDHQVKLAKLFGYEDASYTLAVEQFMQKYYRTVQELARLNEMLLQLFEEAILLDPAAPPRPLNARFQVRNEFLEVTDEEVFERTPSALLEIFLLLQQEPGLKGVSARTIRLLRRALPLIDEEFRQNPRHHRLFMDIIKAPEGVTHELRRMNRYGVLGRYIPAFGRVTGRMQFDLFHAYTVDAHTLFVVSNLRRFALARFDHEMPMCSRIMQALPKPELAYLAGLFHDIAKGRGGDHSELGAVDAEAFCLEHGLSPYDARLVAWLVRHHLTFSITAQKKDIHDPAVVASFARTVGDETRLDYLYVLTVADVRGTSPKLWNAWKASLFEEFYLSVKRALRAGLESPIDSEQLVAETQDAALALLAARGIRAARAREVWGGFAQEYFLRHTPEEIAWHIRVLATLEDRGEQAAVSVEQQTGRGGTAIMVCTQSGQHSFARATGALDELGLNILDARVVPVGDGRNVHTYVVLESDGSPIDDHERLVQIETAVRKATLEHADRMPTVLRQPPRQVRLFTTPTRIAFSRDEANGRTVVELIAADRPGLLCEVGKAFVECGLSLRAAKIMTVGERAEDVFYITELGGETLDAAACAALEQRLKARLDQPEAVA